MIRNLNNAELIQELETAEKRITELESKLAQKVRRLDEYERAERECQEREQKLNQLLEILPVGISILDVEDNIVYSNPALQKILQINQEGLLNGSYRDRRYMAADGAPMPLDGFASRQAKQRAEPVYDVETGIVKEDGDIIWTNVSAMPVNFSDWKLILTTTDITTRKNAEEEQRRSQDRLAKIFQTSPVPMVIGDAETSQFIEVNQAYERLVGYDRHEIVGHTPFELDIYPDKEQLIRARNDIQTQDGLHGAELTLRTKSNEFRNILAWSQVLRLSNGQMINLGTALDVTGARLVEQSLRENEARYRSLFENSPVVIWEEDFSAVKSCLEDLGKQGVTDLDAYLTTHEELLHECIQLVQVTDVNRAALLLYGASSKPDLMGSLRNTFPREAVAGFKDELLQVAKQGLSFHGESFVRTFDGQLHRVIVDWTVLPGYEQTYEKVLVTLSDITDLRQAQEKYQGIFENSAEGIFQTTPDGRFLSANPALARIYGYDSPQELIQSVANISSEIYLKPEQREEFLQMLESKGAIESFESRDRRKDGSIIWTSASARVVRDANGQTLYYEGFLQDITERKRAEAAALESEARYHRVLDAMMEGCQIIDFEWRYFYVNEVVAKQGKKRPEELLHHTMMEVYPGIENTEMFAALRRCMEQRVPERLENRFVLPDGSAGWFELSIQPTQEGIFILSTDITERKQAEQALADNEKRFRAMIENGLDDISLLDAQGHLLWESPAVVRNLGYAPDEYLGRDIFGLMHPEDRGWTNELFAKLIREPGGRQHGSFRLRHANGSWRWVEGVATNLLDEPSVGGVVVNYRDITERKKAEMALRDSEEKYRLLFETNPIPMWIYDLETLRFLKVNTAAINHYGYAELEFMSMTIKDIRPPEETPWLLENIVQVKHGIDTAGVWTHIKKDGSPIQVEIISHVVDFDGRPAKLVLVNDISERIRAEEALHESEQKYRNLVETSHDLIWSVDQDGLFTYLNQASHEVYGYEPEELLGHSFLEILDPAYSTWDWDTFKKNIADWDKFVDVESVVRHRDGRQIILSANFLVLHDENNNLIGIVGTSRDITERKRAEEALRESEERFSSAFKFAPIGMALVSLEGRWLKVNQAICELVGYTQEELQAMTFQQVTYPDDLEADLNQVKQLLAGAIDSYQMEKRYIHKLGRLVWVLLGVSLIKDLQGRPTYFISQIQDITERKQAELVIQQRNEDLSLLDAVNEALNRNESLSAVIALVSERLRQIFKGYGATIYLLDADRQKLVNQNLALPPDLVDKIEKLFGSAIPRLQFDLQRTHPFRGVYETKKTQVMNDPQSVQQHYLAFAEAVPPNPTLRAVARKIMPLVQKLVDVQAELLVPLISKEELLGVIDLGGSLSFTEENVQRVESIASQLTAAIQRKQAEEALHHSEEQYRSLFEDSPIALWLEDFSRVKQLLNQLKQEGMRDIRAYLHGHPEFVRECLDCVRILDVNNAATKLFHVKHKNELLGSLSAAVPYLLPEQFETELLQIAEGRISFEWDEDGYTTTGQKISLHLRWSVVPGYEGDLAKVIVSMVDITERKQAEENLRRSETRYRLATQATNDVIWEWDAIAHQLLWSENAQVVFGYRAEEIGPEEKWWDEHIHPDDLERILSKLDEFTNSPGSIWSEEYRFRRKDGSYAYVSDRAYMERDSDGNPLRLIGAMSDITERKKNEAETRRRADEFAVLYETARDLATQYNLPTLLNTIVERACQLLHTPSGGIYLYDEARDDLELVLAVGTTVSMGTRLKMGEGMAGHVAQTQLRLIVDDYSTWAGRSAQFESIPFRAILEVPMLYGGQVIGVLVVHELHESERKFTEADAHLLSLFAEYAASAVHAARLLQQTTRRAEETAALLETSLALTSLDLESTLQTFGERAQSLFEADSCRIFLMEPDGETLRCVLALQESSEAFSHLRIKLGVGVTGAVAASGRAEIVNEMQSDPRAIQIAGTPDEEEAVMFAPLKARDRTLGVLSVRRVGTQRPFQPADLALLEALASMSASAVSNARLFEQTEQRLNELQALYENGLAVGRLLEPQAIGERIIQTVSQYLSWHHVTIRLCKENSDELELVAFHLPHMPEEKTTEDEQRFKFHVSRVGQGLSGWVVQTGSPIRTSNLSADPHYVNIYEGMQSGLYMPLKAGDRVMGVISVESEEPDAFSEQDERLLATLANQAATAFENARLYQSAQQKIHERRIAEEALRQSEENYRRLARELEDRVYERTAEVQDLYDNAPCGYLSLDADGNIVRINQTELDWMGYTREEMLGHPFANFVTYESHNIFKETFPAFKQQGSIRDLELEMLRKDGSVLPILVSATAVYDQDGKYLTSRSTLSDDTSRKHAMETLRLANAEMKRAMRMKDEFLANMSHELRTPLNAILGLSESLLEQTAGPINEKQQKYLGTVNESGRHLLELINDILDLAKIESGQIKIDPGRVNINTVCEASLRMIKQLAQKKNQTVEVEIEKEIGYVWADERRLKQMMVNLLSNAVKFTPVDGQLGLKASIDRHDMKLLITIWDHGIGIREEDLNRLFRPFVQLDSSLARESSGTGLGLALVAEMARLHGGSVSVASQPGQGSEFTISLPWDPAITTDTLDKLRVSGKIPLMKRISTEKQTILLVEDTDSVVLMLRDYLELSGYKVEIARNGLDGVSKAISVRPDLILMDVQMPGLDGLEATRRIRRDDSLKHTPIIALTALAMPSDRARCLEAGMDDYLSKPINLKELAKAVLRNLPDSETGKKS